MKQGEAELSVLSYLAMRSRAAYIKTRFSISPCLQCFGPKQLCALGHLGCALVFVLIVTNFDLKSFKKAIRIWWFILMWDNVMENQRYVIYCIGYLPRSPKQPNYVIYRMIMFRGISPTPPTYVWLHFVSNSLEVNQNIFFWQRM